MRTENRRDPRRPGRRHSSQRHCHEQAVHNFSLPCRCPSRVQVKAATCHPQTNREQEVGRGLRSVTSQQSRKALFYLEHILLCILSSFPQYKCVKSQQVLPCFHFQTQNLRNKNNRVSILTWTYVSLLLTFAPVGCHIQVWLDITYGGVITGHRASMRWSSSRS